MVKNVQSYLAVTSRHAVTRPSLAAYVRRRNGVPLGASGSLSGMLYRSFGSSSFQQFWNYWNPIWGYYLGYLLFRPLRNRLPNAVAVVATFAISGVVHDLAVSLIFQIPSMTLTPWFTLMGVMVVVSTGYKVSYAHHHWLVRASLNLVQLVGSFLLIRWALVL